MASTRNSLFLIIGLGILFFFPFLGNVHLFDWDEINFAESAREMIVTGDYYRVRINYDPFWEKPPLFFWLQVISMKLFGINEFAARFPNALFGIITLVTLFFMGKKLYSNKFGLIWSLLYLGSFLPHLYFKTGIIDPIFNFFIFLSVYFLARNLTDDTKKGKWALFSGLFIGLAIITKGPVALLLLLLTFGVYLIYKKFKVKIRIKDVLILAISAFFITFIWFGYEVITNGPWFIIEFIKYQIELFTQPVAGHEQPFFYHFVVILIGCFPLSIVALGAFKKEKEKTPFDFTLWTKILFWIVLILFTIVKTKIVHYSSMCYLPLSFLAARYFYQVIQEKETLKKFISVLILVFGIIFSILLIITPLLFFFKDFLKSLLKDPFAEASLNFDLGFTGFEFIIGLIYLAGLIVGFIYLKRKLFMKSLYVLTISAGITLLGYSIFVVPKIERFSQGPAIDFYKEKASEDAYITTLWFKSYAHYFYGKVKPCKETDYISTIKKNYVESLQKSSDFNVIDLNTQVNNWLLNGDIDKKTYFVTKINRREEMKHYKNVIFIKNSGGFDFYYRSPQN